MNGPLRLLAALAALAAGMAACAPAQGPENPARAPAADAPAADSTAGRPARIVSLDYCADQYVLALAPRSAIAGLSPDAVREFSHMRDLAGGLPRLRPDVESVLAARPDLVVRAYGGGPDLVARLQRAGIRVHQIGFGERAAAIRAAAAEAAAAMHAPERGARLLAAFDARVSALAAAAPPAGAPKPRALYVTPAGFTSGDGTLADTIISLSGHANMETAPGWRALPLERLAIARPDALALAFADTLETGADAWAPARHAAWRARAGMLPTARMKAAALACPGWFNLDAAEALARLRRPAPGAGA